MAASQISSRVALCVDGFIMGRLRISAPRRDGQIPLVFMSCGTLRIRLQSVKTVVAFAETQKLRNSGRHSWHSATARQAGEAAVRLLDRSCGEEFYRRVPGRVRKALRRYFAGFRLSAATHPSQHTNTDLSATGTWIGLPIDPSSSPVTGQVF